MDFSTMVQHWPLHAVVALIAGVVVLLAPRVLNYAVAIYLLVIGALGLLHFFYGQAIRPQTVISLVAGTRPAPSSGAAVLIIPAGGDGTLTR